MGRGFRSTQDLCPECGHLLTTKSLNCRFCGWNMDNSKPHASAAGSWNDYPEADNFSFIDLDVEQLAD
jgi:rubredoxin